MWKEGGLLNQWLRHGRMEGQALPSMEGRREGQAFPSLEGRREGEERERRKLGGRMEEGELWQ